MGMPPPVPTVHCCVCYPGVEGIQGGGGSVREDWCLCCVRHRHKEENSLGVVTRKGGGYYGKEGSSGCVGTLALYVGTQFEISSFSRFGDVRAITRRTTELATDRTTDIATGLNIVSFVYRRAEA